MQAVQFLVAMLFLSQGFFLTRCRYVLSFYGSIMKGNPTQFHLWTRLSVKKTMSDTCRDLDWSVNKDGLDAGIRLFNYLSLVVRICVEGHFNWNSTQDMHLEKSFVMCRGCHTTTWWHICLLSFDLEPTDFCFWLWWKIVILKNKMSYTKKIHTSEILSRMVCDKRSRKSDFNSLHVTGKKHAPCEGNRNHFRIIQWHAFIAWESTTAGDCMPKTHVVDLSCLHLPFLVGKQHWLKLWLLFLQQVKSAPVEEQEDLCLLSDHFLQATLAKR